MKRDDQPHRAHEFPSRSHEASTNWPKRVRGAPLVLRFLGSRRRAQALGGDLEAERRRAREVLAADFAAFHDEIWERFPAAAAQIRARIRMPHQPQKERDG